MPGDENHVALPVKVAKEEVVLQKPANSTTSQDTRVSVSTAAYTYTPPTIDSKPTCVVSTSPPTTLTLPRTEQNVSPIKPSPALISTESTPFTSPNVSDHGGRGITSPAVDNRGLTPPAVEKRGITSPIVDGIIGVLCPTSNSTPPKKPDNHAPLELSPFSPFLPPALKYVLLYRYILNLQFMHHHHVEEMRTVMLQRLRLQGTMHVVYY